MVTKYVLAGGAALLLVAPLAASAHTTGSHRVATSTEARLSARAQHLVSAADFLGSLSGNLSVGLANADLSASSSATAKDKLADYNTSVASAKVEAQDALDVAAQLGTTSAATGTEVLAGQARTDLKAARGFIREATQDLQVMVRFIFRF